MKRAIIAVKAISVVMFFKEMVAKLYWIESRFMYE